jgi:uncharacterized membrane protein YqjE
LRNVSVRINKANGLPRSDVRSMRGVSLTAGHQLFNSQFYAASVTVIPIFFITLAVELRAVSSPVMRRMIALYRYRKLRRFESIRDRMHFMFRGLLLFATALLPIVTVLGLAAEVAGLVALDQRSVGRLTHVIVVLGVIALPAITLLWAILIREREPTPFEADLDELAKRRDRTMFELDKKMRSMRVDASPGNAVDQHRVRHTQRRLATLTRQDKRLGKATDKTRRALRTLRERDERYNRQS